MERYDELFEKQMGLKMSQTQRVIVQTAGLDMEPEEFGRRYMERYLELPERPGSK